MSRVSFSKQLRIRCVRCGPVAFLHRLLRKSIAAAGDVVTSRGNLRGHGAHYGLARLASQPPVGMQMAFLMTDGSVLAQGDAGNDWYKYAPDINGNYSDGTWTQVGDDPKGYAP